MVWLGLLLFLVWLIGFTFLMLGLRMAPRRLQQWADRNGFTVIDSERLWSVRTPFVGMTQSQAVFRVVFQDGQGRRRSAWVMCGSPSLGAWTDRVEVRWDEEGEKAGWDRGWFDSPAMMRFHRKTIAAWGLRYLVVGGEVGSGIGLLLVVLTGDGVEKVILPLLVLSMVMGAVVGGAAGVIGGSIHVRAKPDAPQKIIVDEL